MQAKSKRNLNVGSKSPIPLVLSMALLGQKRRYSGSVHTLDHSLDGSNGHHASILDFCLGFLGYGWPYLEVTSASTQGTIKCQ